MLDGATARDYPGHHRACNHEGARMGKRDELLERFDKLNVWSRGDQRAPHKPLLVLYALGRWSRGETGDIPFRDVDADLTGLLKEIGPPRQSNHPEYPFWRLQNDGVWAVHAAGPLTPPG